MTGREPSEERPAVKPATPTRRLSHSPDAINSLDEETTAHATLTLVSWRARLALMAPATAASPATAQPR